MLTGCHFSISSNDREVKFDRGTEGNQLNTISSIFMVLTHNSLIIHECWQGVTLVFLVMLERWNLTGTLRATIWTKSCAYFPMAQYSLIIQECWHAINQPLHKKSEIQKFPLTPMMSFWDWIWQFFIDCWLFIKLKDLSPFIILPSNPFLLLSWSK